MSLCVAAGAKLTVIAATTFTLSWTHSVEKTAWEEDWIVSTAGLELAAARVKGSGAGMEPPADAVLLSGWWHYRPSRAPRKEIVLATSGATETGWRICTENRCVALSEAGGGERSITLRPCAPGLDPQE
jgi:hypothetical protein